MEIIDCSDATVWEAWLAAHHGARGDVWIRIAKKASGIASVTAAEATTVALCFGWIDSQRNAGDAVSFLQRYSPRRRRSPWSQINVERAEALIAAGRMRPAGFAEIEAARADGRWDAAYASQRTARVPPDLTAALAADDAARAHFESLGRSERYAAILPVLQARHEAGRAAQVGRMLARLGAAAR